MQLECGTVVRAPYPFVRDTYERHEQDADGWAEVKTPTWRPGVRPEFVYPDDSEAVADGMGNIILRVISMHKPGRYPTRVFFVRQWEDPAGNIFGKCNLRVATLEKFTRLSRGYRFEFRLAAVPAAAE